MDLQRKIQEFNELAIKICQTTFVLVKFFVEIFIVPVTIQIVNVTESIINYVNSLTYNVAVYTIIMWYGPLITLITLLFTFFIGYIIIRIFLYTMQKNKL